MNNILYLDLSMGASGDMLTSALLGLCENPNDVLQELNNIGIPRVNFTRSTVTKCGLVANMTEVVIDGNIVEGLGYDHEDRDHHGMHFDDIEELINGFRINDLVKANSLKTYKYIQEAEAKAHECPMEHVHFHEVGTIDAVADVVAVCFLMDRINPEQIIASPINVGSGFVKCAHGMLTVPAPAVVNLLESIPYYQSDIKSELCTPTGAALVKVFVEKYSLMPVMLNTCVSYGAGHKNFEIANVVRATLGQTLDEENIVCRLETQVDDMTGEDIAFATEILQSQGALDVFTSPIYMKKNRPGISITVICDLSHRTEMIKSMFKHTTTIGIREWQMARHELDRTFEKRNSELGSISAKVSSGFGFVKEKLEFEDLAHLAKEQDSSIFHIRESFK